MQQKQKIITVSILLIAIVGMVTSSVLVNEVDAAKKKISKKSEKRDGADGTPGQTGSSSQAVSINGIDGQPGQNGNPATGLPGV